MAQVLPLFPDQASSAAPGVDHLFYFLLAVTAIFTVLIFSLPEEGGTRQVVVDFLQR